VSRLTRDLAGRTVFNALAAITPRRKSISPRNRIGVFLFWGLGDAVLTTPFLKALRAAYPHAHIEAIGKPWLADLFGDEGLFDSFRTLVPPWTKHTQKYRLWSPEWRDFAATVCNISESYDLLVSLRPDPREAALARCMTSAEFAGYAAPGGKAWVTTDLGRDVANEPATYRGELAARAAAVLFGNHPDPSPHLTAPEPTDIAAQLSAIGYRGGPVLAVSFGAAHPIRRWSGDRIAATLSQLRRQPGAYLLIESDDAPQVDVPSQVPVLRWRGSMRDLKRTLAATDVLFCTDSGVMHVGTAMGCATVSVFGSGAISRFAPRGPQHTMYAVEPMPCRPCYDTCIYPSPLCIDRIETEDVADLLSRSLAALTQGRVERFLG